jgi:hypothetical protein
MLRSIVYQIWSQNEKLFPLLRDRYRAMKKQSNNETMKELFWRYDNLKAALQSLHEIEFSLQVFIVVDGMDELDNAGRNEVLRFLPGLSARASRCIVKLLFASRSETDINIYLMQARHIVLQEVNTEDIRKVVDRGIGELECLSRGRKKDTGLSLSELSRTPITFSKIKDCIVENSEGVFI